MAVCLLGGVSSAWAEGEIAFTTGNTIGSTNNSDGWYGAKSEIFTLGSNQTLTLKFKSFTATDSQLGGTAWGSYMTHVINFWDGRDQNLFMRGDGYGWKAHNGLVNDPEDFNTNGEASSTTYTYNATDFGETSYRAIVGETGVDVVMTIERFGKEIRISQEFTTSTGVKYHHYFVGSFGTEAGDIWGQMTIDHAHIVVSEDKAITTSDKKLTGTLIGKLNNTGRLADHGNIENFTIAPNGSLTLNFKHYTNKIETWGNWLFEVQYDTKLYTLSVGNKNSWGVLKVGENLTSTNWPTTDTDLKDKLNGASVALTVVRSGSTVTMTAVMTPTSGDDITLVSSINLTDVDGFATSDITVRLLAELSHLDLLPITTQIGATGYSTFSNAYALNLSEISGATAYYASAVGTSTITLTETTDKVPAGEGLILKGTANANVTIPVVGSGTAISGNKLVGCTTETVLGNNANYYVLVNNGGTAEFQSLEDYGATIPAGKAYLNAEAVGARSLNIVFTDETTGIEAAKTVRKAADAKVYNLNGQRVATPQKGLYIVNGKKVVIK